MSELALFYCVLTVILAVQFLVSSSFVPAANVLIKVQAVYWWLSYVARPIYLQATTPAPGEVLYDPRMYFLGYDVVLSAILPPIILGQIVFLVVLVVLRLVLRRGTGAKFKIAGLPNVPPYVLIFFYGAALVVRALATLAGLSKPGFLLAFSNYVPAMVIAFWPTSARRRILVITILSIAEMAWAVVIASKTPVLTVILALLVRAAVSGGTKRILKFAVPAVLVVILAFVALQPLRGVDTVSRAQSQGQGAVTATITSVLERTDTLTPVTDAFFLPTKPWLNPGQYVESVLTGVVPTGIHEAVGVRWTREVKTASFSKQFQDVFIASGVTAEGYAQGGLGGVALENLLLVLITLSAAYSLHSRRIPLAVGAAVFVFDSAMYEGGLLWIAECGSGAVVAASLSWALLLMKRRSQDRRNSDTKSRSNLRTSAPEKA